MTTKKIIGTGVTLLLLGLLSIPAFAASSSCTVASLEGDTLVLQCDDKNTFKVGDTVKVKPEKAKKQVEGC